MKVNIFPYSTWTDCTIITGMTPGRLDIFKSTFQGKTLVTEKCDSMLKYIIFPLCHHVSLYVSIGLVAILHSNIDTK